MCGRCEDSTAFGVRNTDNRTQTDTPSPVLFFLLSFILLRLVGATFGDRPTRSFRTLDVTRILLVSHVEVRLADLTSQLMRKKLPLPFLTEHPLLDATAAFTARRCRHCFEYFLATCAVPFFHAIFPSKQRKQ